jgi:adenylate kinase
MRTALTGVPGTGKTSIAALLAQRHGARVVRLQEFALERGLVGERDDARDTRLVDVDALAASLRDVEYDVVEGHYAHEMDVDRVVLLRCDPLVLVERLRARAGWSEAKVRENVEAEALDVLAQEVLDTGLPAVEVDVTRLRVEEAAERVWHIAVAAPEALKGDRVGTARWRLEALPWS